MSSDQRESKVANIALDQNPQLLANVLELANRDNNSNEQAYKSIDREKEFSEVNELNKLNNVFKQYSSQFYSEDNQVSCKCLMNIEGCEMEFNSKKEMYIHLVTECCYFVCRLCSERLKSKDKQEIVAPETTIPIKLKSDKQRFFVTFDYDSQSKNHMFSTKSNALIKKNTNTPPMIKSQFIPEMLVVERAIDLYILQIKQASFLVDNSGSFNHYKNLYSHLLSIGELVSQSLKEPQSCSVSNLRFCLTNLDNIPVEDEFAHIQSNNSNSTINNNDITPKSICENENNQHNSIRTPKLINNKNISLNRSIIDKNSNSSFIFGIENENILGDDIDNDLQLSTLLMPPHSTKNKNWNKKFILTKISSPKADQVSPLEKFGRYSFSKASPSNQAKLKFRIINHSTSLFKLKQEYESHSPILCIEYLQDSNIAIAGNEDSSISIFDLSQKSNRRYSTYKAVNVKRNEHVDEVRLIKSLRVPKLNQVRQGNTIVEIHKFLSIDRKGTLISWHLEVRCSNSLMETFIVNLKVLEKHHKLLNGARCIEIVNESQLLFHDSLVQFKSPEIECNFLVLIGMKNGDIAYFISSSTSKIIKESIKYVTNHHREPLISLVTFDNIIASASLDNKLAVWSWTTKKSIGLYEEQIEHTHPARLICMKKVTVDMLCVLYEDNCIKTYSLKSFKMIAIISHIYVKHKAKMTAISILNSSIVICYDNKEMMIYSLKLPDNANDNDSKT